MSLTNTSQVVGSGLGFPISRSGPQDVSRKKLIKRGQVTDVITDPQEMSDQPLELPFLSKESSFKEELAGSVFQKQLSENLSRKVSQLFDGIRLEIEVAEKRLTHSISLYDVKTQVFEEKITGIAFSYLSRINYAITAIANNDDVPYALNEAKTAFEAIDDGFSSTLDEINELGILTHDMTTAFERVNSKMKKGLLNNASSMITGDVEQVLSGLGDKKFATLLTSTYNLSSAQDPSSSSDEKIYAGIESKQIVRINMQALTGETIGIYIANENNLPLAEKWFMDSDIILNTVSLQKSRYLKLLAGFDEHLEVNESLAVSQMLSHFIGLGELYFINNIGSSYLAAENNGYSTVELIAYLTDQHRKLYRKNINTYNDVAYSYTQSSGTGVGELAQLEEFVQRLYALMIFAQDFRIDNSDDFVCSILSSIILYDSRQNYDYYRSDRSSQEVITCLIRGIRDTGL